jgi:hypothetical protein
MSAVTFTASNKGGALLTGFSVSINGADFAMPPVTNHCAGLLSLAPGDSCSFDVVFRPVSPGPKTGSVIASATGQTVTATLAGTAQRPAQLVTSPMTVDFVGTLGQTGPSVNVIVANVGDVATGALTVLIEGANAQDFKVVSNGCLAPLARSSTCQVALAFQPQTAGMKAAVLKVTAPAAGMAATALTGTAEFPSTLTITPKSATFGPVAVGSTSLATSFEVRNTGGTATAALTAGTNSGEFIITANTCGGATLPVNGTCNVSVVFRPASVGTKNGYLTVMGGSNEILIAALQGSTP